jgi:hypothetical protein
MVLNGIFGDYFIINAVIKCVQKHTREKCVLFVCLNRIYTSVAMSISALFCYVSGIYIIPVKGYLSTCCRQSVHVFMFVNRVVYTCL